MRLMMAATAFSMLATTAWAAPAVVTENLTTTITGTQTVDTRGYFGPVGADLSGATARIYFQYVPSLLGATQTCRNKSCTYNEAFKTPDVAGSLLVTVTINGRRVVYTPAYQATMFFNVQSPYQLTVDSDVNSGFGLGLSGIQLDTQFTSAPKFDQLLSPGDQPTLNTMGDDYIFFYEPDDQLPVETLTYAVTAATK